MLGTVSRKIVPLKVGGLEAGTNYQPGVWAFTVIFKLLVLILFSGDAHPSD